MKMDGFLSVFLNNASYDNFPLKYRVYINQAMLSISQKNNMANKKQEKVT